MVILAGFLAIVIALVLVALNKDSEGGFGHGDTSVEGPAWLILFVLGILLIAGGFVLP